MLSTRYSFPKKSPLCDQGLTGRNDEFFGIKFPSWISYFSTRIAFPRLAAAREEQPREAAATALLNNCSRALNLTPVVPVLTLPLSFSGLSEVGCLGRVRKLAVTRCFGGATASATSSPMRERLCSNQAVHSRHAILHKSVPALFPHLRTSVICQVRSLHTTAASEQRPSTPLLLPQAVRAPACSPAAFYDIHSLVSCWTSRPIDQSLLCQTPGLRSFV